MKSVPRSSRTVVEFADRMRWICRCSSVHYWLTVERTSDDWISLSAVVTGNSNCRRTVPAAAILPSISSFLYINIYINVYIFGDRWHSVPGRRGGRSVYTGTAHGLRRLD